MPSGHWAVTADLLVNAATRALFLILIMQDPAGAAFLIACGISRPCNLAAILGIWRASARHDGPAIQDDFSRGATAVRMVTLNLTMTFDHEE